MTNWIHLLLEINVIHHINRIKEKNLTIITTDAEQAFDKTQQPLKITTLSKPEIEGNFMKQLASYLIMGD